MQISYSVKYSNRKTLSIIVERDRSVIVRAPINTPDSIIDREINKRKNLLLKKINHPQKYKIPVDKKEFVSGESLLYFGNYYKLEVVSQLEDDILFDKKFYINKSNQTQAGLILKNWYFERAKEKIIPRVQFYSKQLGVTFRKISILDLRYRWGSCTPKNNVNFNWRLIKAPSYVIDYIIVHELAHLLEANHTPEFWNIVSVQLPNYEKSKEWLKENGNQLEMDF